MKKGSTRKVTLETLAGMMQEEFAQLHRKIDGNHGDVRRWFRGLAGELLEIKVDHEERIKRLEEKAGIR